MDLLSTFFHSLIYPLIFFLGKLEFLVNYVIIPQVSGALPQIFDLIEDFIHYILESNVFNIGILLSGISYLGTNALSAALYERQRKILGVIREAELRVQRSRIRLEQSVLQYLYISFETTFIQQEALSFANVFRNVILNDGQEQVDRLDAIRQARCLIHKISVCKSMSDKLVALALKPVPDKLDDQLTSNSKKKCNPIVKP